MRDADHHVYSEPYTIALPQGGYHSQFWVEDGVSRNLMCRGVFGQLIYINFAHDMDVVKLSACPAFLNVRATIATLAAVEQIAAFL